MFRPLPAFLLAAPALAAASVPVSAQLSYRESAATALDRHIRVLAKSPKDFLALIGAGKAALERAKARADKAAAAEVPAE